MEPNTEYNRKQHQDSMQRKVNETIEAIRAVTDHLLTENFPTITDRMDVVEKVIVCCGGEKKVNFLEVSSDMIKIGTRIPMKANIFPFLPDDATSNDRFHKIVTKVLLCSEFVHSVRWIPQEEGACLIIALNP